MQKHLLRPGRKKRTRHDREFNRALGAKLRERRRQMGLVQEQLASRIGLTISQIGRYENGVTAADAPMLQKFANVLKCHPGDFFTDLHVRSPKS